MRSAPERLHRPAHAAWNHSGRAPQSRGGTFDGGADQGHTERVKASNGVLTNQSDSAIMRVAKGQLSHANHAKKLPRYGRTGGAIFYIKAPPSGMGVPSGGFWALSGLLPVKPLADVMANYTRHDRNTKGN